MSTTFAAAVIRVANPALSQVVLSDVPVKPRTVVKPHVETEPKIERPKLYKVILLNDDYTPCEFVVTVLKTEFKIGQDRAYKVMITAHRQGRCVISVYPRDVAETKASRATEHGKKFGYPLQFIAEPEE